MAGKRKSKGGDNEAGAAAHACLRRFVEFTRPRNPRPARARAARFVDDLRERVDGRGVDVLGFFYAGSTEKGTALRRFKSRESDIPGQGLDLVISVGMLPVSSIVSAQKTLAVAAEGLLEAERARLERDFRRDRATLELAPVLDVRGLGQFHVSPDRSIMPVNVRHEHEQIKKRTRSAASLNAKIGFNDAIRLLKWWRYARPPREPVRAPTSLELERLAAAAFDGVGVGPTWQATLAMWCAWLAHDPPRVHLPAPFGEWFAHGASVFAEIDALTERADIVERLDLELFGSACTHANANERS